MLTRCLKTAATFLLLAVSLAAGPRDAEWKKVDEAARQSLPKTAAAQLDVIIAGALADQSYAEATKAIARKIVFEGKILGNKPEERIVAMETEIARAPATMKPVMEAIVAHWYWSYFQQNRGRFAARTETAAAPGPDILTWDLPRIFTEIDRHFTAALADEALLKQTPIATFDDLLVEGDVPDAYRPTLFDFLAYDALQFYQAGEQAGIRREDPFEIETDSPVFASTKDFVAWKPATADATSPLFKAVHLYQALLAFHQRDEDRSAYYDADLARLTFGFNLAVGEDNTGPSKQALQRFARDTREHEISARALALLATQLNAEGEPAQAHATAQRGLAAFAESAGGAMCFNIIQQIQTPSAQLDTESVWNAPWPTLNVTYRNVTKVYFRAIPYSFEEYIRSFQWYHPDPVEVGRVRESAPVLEWSADLPPTPDFKQRTERLAAPATLKPGFYYIIASHAADFAEADNQVTSARIWVSNLALVTTSHNGFAPGTGFVLNAMTGEPLAGAVVRSWHRSREGRFEPDDSFKTDANGRFTLPAGGEQLMLLAEHGGQAVSTLQPVNDSKIAERDSVTTRTTLFTDRAIYRPGQTVNYQGVSLRADQGRGQYKVMAREEIEVVFNDANGNEIARATHVTNDYGSFSGVFTAPRDRLMGGMSLHVDEGPEGYAYFNVEEYKRPKFEVEIPSPAVAAKLTAPVELTGRASAYTGAAIGGAKVKWRVERNVRLPFWCWWWQTPATQAIAHGTGITAPDGTFKIQFTATPDRTVPEKLEPVFTYSIHADVTDTTGETRSAGLAMAAGYTALQAAVQAADWQTPDRPVVLTVTTASLDGVPQAATGTVVIHALKQPARVERAPLGGATRSRGWLRPSVEPPADPLNPDSWATAAVVARLSFKTDITGTATVTQKLNAGIYRVSLETKDRFGKTVTSRRTVEVLDPAARKYGTKLPNRFTAPQWSLQPGEKFSALWGTGYDSGRAFVELECAGETLKSYWTDATRTQERIELPITEAMRGGVTVRVTAVRENRVYPNTHLIEVPWTNQELTLKWERFRSKLLPGQPETWTATITGPDAKPAAAEMVATLYDASLDQYRPLNWPDSFGAFRYENSWSSVALHNTMAVFDWSGYSWRTPSREVDWQYRTFPDELLTVLGDDVLVLSPFEVSAPRATLAGHRINTSLRDAGNAVSVVTAQFLKDSGATNGADLLRYTGNTEAVSGSFMPSSPPPPNLDKVTARKNLNETAFFFPHLLADKSGAVKLQFTMPEALTKWKFLGFAHDKQLRAGLLTGETVTAKDLMVEPNPPRFVREGDAVEFTVKVSNQTDQPQTGRVRLTFADAATLDSRDAALGNRTPEQAFDVPAQQSRSYSWRIAVPDGLDFLTYKAVGATDKLSDGEEGYLPVLSRRILVTESLPLPIRGKATKKFDFAKLLTSGQSDSLRHQSLTVQMVSQPAWYAVEALPYLMEFPYECSEQLFNRYYANAVARHIANSDPKIRRVFELWKNTPALESPLAKNQDLKAVMLEESPWLNQAAAESASRRRVGLLFDANRLDSEAARTLQQLADRQAGSGLWSWFPGGQDSSYISLYIMTGFGRLRHLGVDLDITPALKSVAALDAWMQAHYQRIQTNTHPEEYQPDAIDALYLYGRSFLLADRPVAKEHQAALDFFLDQARKYWTRVGGRQSEAHLALALQRFGDQGTPAAIVRSLRERSVISEEMGMSWNDGASSWWWYAAPIETQAMMVEVFAEVAHDDQAVEDCKVWLLKQKQTQDWKTTKATADAIYALLLRGANLLASDASVEVSLAGQSIKPEKVEAGTGFYEHKFIRDEIKPAMGRITVKKVDDGVSWGSAHWQYLEDIAKVTPHEGTPLKLKKTLYVKENTGRGPVLKAVSGPLAVGDELVVRLELRTDRDMEYVHLKDQRGSGTEPLNVLSQYKYQDGLGYYESTRDTASHFFIDSLPKGTYVFEYSVRVQLKGSYQSGIAEIQCMYAPEFNSHSESVTIDVK